MNKDRINRLYSFFDAIRGNNTPSEHEKILAVLKKVTDIQEQSIGKLSDIDLYNIMKRTLLMAFKKCLSRRQKNSHLAWNVWWKRIVIRILH